MSLPWVRAQRSVHQPLPSKEGGAWTLRGAVSGAALLLLCQEGRLEISFSKCHRAASASPTLPFLLFLFFRLGVRTTVTITISSATSDPFCRGHGKQSVCPGKPPSTQRSHNPC